MPLPGCWCEQRVERRQPTSLAAPRLSELSRSDWAWWGSSKIPTGRRHESAFAREQARPARGNWLSSFYERMAAGPPGESDVVCEYSGLLLSCGKIRSSITTRRINPKKIKSRAVEPWRSATPRFESCRSNTYNGIAIGMYKSMPISKGASGAGN